MVEKQVDILIIGGGLIGATLLLALQKLGFSTLLVESKPLEDRVKDDFDARTLALSPASQRILKMLGLWDIIKIHATAINFIHISEQARFGASRLHAKEEEPLGYVVEMQHVNLALHQLLEKNQVMAPATLIDLDLLNKTVKLATPSGEVNIKAELIVAADGTQSTVRALCKLPTQSKEYNQQALVANVGLLRPHGHRAFERFTSDGLLALLPMKDKRMSLVWATVPNKAQNLLSLDETDFLKELQKVFGYRLGPFTKIGQRFSYPLKQVLMPQQSKGPVLFMGNAAHTLHPVAGQGFNLGLRDAATLAQCIRSMGLDEAMLKEYLQLRRHDQKAITQFTDGLIRLFGSRLPGMGLIRQLGLLAFDNSPVLKNTLAHYAQGFGGISSDLACEIALSK